MPTLLIFAALALMASAMSILFLGELAIPLAAAALSAVFLLERGRARIFSLIIPVVIFVLNVLIYGVLSYLSLEIIAMALILSHFFLKSSKSESAFWLTFVSTAFSVLAMALVAYLQTKQLSVDSVIDFYLAMYADVEAMFVESFADMSILFGVTADQATAEIAVTVLRSIASIIPSIIIIFAFAMGGVALKLQCIMIGAVADDEVKEKLGFWRFSLSTPIHYAFWIFLLLKFVFELSGATSVFAITVMNIYNVLLYVFAYLGLGVVISMLTKWLKKRSLAILATVGAIFLFSGLAIEIIAYFGAAFVFYIKKKTDGNK